MKSSLLTDFENADLSESGENFKFFKHFEAKIHEIIGSFVGSDPFNMQAVTENPTIQRIIDFFNYIGGYMAV